MKFSLNSTARKTPTRRCQCTVSPQNFIPSAAALPAMDIRQTLKMIQQRIPLQLSEVPSGTAVFDWTVPKRVEHP